MSYTSPPAGLTTQIASDESTVCHAGSSPGPKLQLSTMRRALSPQVRLGLDKSPDGLRAVGQRSPRQSPCKLLHRRDAQCPRSLQGRGQDGVREPLFTQPSSPMRVWLRYRKAGAFTSRHGRWDFTKSLRPRMAGPRRHREPPPPSRRRTCRRLHQRPLQVQYFYYRHSFHNAVSAARFSDPKRGSLGTSAFFFLDFPSPT